MCRVVDVLANFGSWRNSSADAGSTRPTRNVDVTPATTRENLDRLAAAVNW